MEFDGSLEGFDRVEMDEALLDLLLQIERSRHLSCFGTQAVCLFLGFVILTYTFNIILLFVRTNNMQFAVDGVHMLELDAFILHF